MNATLQKSHPAQSHLWQSDVPSHLPKVQVGTVGPAPFPTVATHGVGGIMGGGDTEASLTSPLDSALHSRSRGGQSAQSLPKVQLSYLDPNPPSSHFPSFENMQPVPHKLNLPLMQSDPAILGPQSWQSCPKPQEPLNLVPGPPSSQCPSSRL